MGPVAGGHSEPGRTTILVVEDDPILRASTSDDLRARHYQVFEAGTAVEGAQILRASGGVDVVFADVNLPGVMGGLSFAVWMHERYPEIPVILTSGVKAVGPAVKGAGRVPFVPKPYRLDDVTRLIDEAVSARGRTR
jgi:two-component system, response regulator PdtaR